MAELGLVIKKKKIKTTQGKGYLAAFFGIVVMSYFTAPLGAKLAHKLPANQLKRLLGLLLIILAIKMFFFPK